MRIVFDNVSYSYMPGTPFAYQALEGLSFEIPAGAFVSIMGDTGSGKTTALQLIKGLIQPASGQIRYYLHSSQKEQYKVQKIETNDARLNYTIINEKSVNNANNIKEDNKEIYNINENNITESNINETTARELVYPSKKLKKKEKEELRKLWQTIGYAFQYPEDQLFEETVELDVGFGPKNYGQSPREIDLSVREALARVGLDYEEIHDRSPLALSGGQMRRVALAGVLASRPQVMILDEPLAGLDPKGKAELMQRLYQEHLEKGWTSLCVSHHIDETWDYSDYFLIFDRGRLAFAGDKGSLIQAWSQGELDQEPASIIKLALALQSKGLIQEQELVAISDQLTTSQTFASYLAAKALAKKNLK